MSEQIENYLYMLRYIGIVFPVLIGVLLITLILSSVTSAQATNSSSSIYSGSYDSSNAVTNSMTAMAYQVKTLGSEINYSVSNSFHTASESLSRFNNLIVHSSKTFVGSVGHSIKLGSLYSVHITAKGTIIMFHGLRSGGAFIVHSATSGIVSLVKIPYNSAQYIANTSVLRSTIEPAYYKPVEIIDHHPSISFASAKVLPVQPTSSIKSQPEVTPQWPIHGEITTEFGANDYPFQLHHTGIDISDGRPSGNSSVHPFRSGRVLNIIKSYGGLGNHVIIDHGNGLTSVYGHLYSISVQVGQSVDMGTILGYEGTTGASTGPHVHFEIRVSNVAVNPHLYIEGNP